MDIQRIKPIKKTDKTKESSAVKKSEPVNAALFGSIMTAAVGGVSDIDKVDDSDFEEITNLHDQFIATVNHEINNPLFVLRGMTELLEDDSGGELKNSILTDVDSIMDEISSFAGKDIPAVGKQCKNSPIQEIAYRKDLVGCYLAKVIGPLTTIIRNSIDNMEKVLNIDSSQPGYDKLEMEKVKNSLAVIQRQAVRIRGVIDKLEKMLPDDIEITQYVDNLKMVKLK